MFGLQREVQDAIVGGLQPIIVGVVSIGQKVHLTIQRGGDRKKGGLAERIVRFRVRIEHRRKHVHRQFVGRAGGGGRVVHPHVVRALSAAVHDGIIEDRNTIATGVQLQVLDKSTRTVQQVDGNRDGCSARIGHLALNTDRTVPAGHQLEPVGRIVRCRTGPELAADGGAFGNGVRLSGAVVGLRFRLRCQPDGYGERAGQQEPGQGWGRSSHEVLDLGFPYHRARPGDVNDRPDLFMIAGSGCSHSGDVPM